MDILYPQEPLLTPDLLKPNHTYQVYYQDGVARKIHDTHQDLIVYGVQHGERFLLVNLATGRVWDYSNEDVRLNPAYRYRELKVRLEIL
jgi:hypothetical protein